MTRATQRAARDRADDTPINRAAPEMLAIVARTRDAHIQTTTVVERGEKGCAVGASSDTSSFLAEQTLLELRYIHRTIERLEQSIVTLPAKRDAERRERRSRNHEFLLGLLGAATLGILIGLTLTFVAWRFLILV